MGLFIIPNQWLLGLGAILLVSSVAVLVFNKGHRDVVLHKLHFHQHRRSSGASTPPRSLSISKESSVSCTTPDYITVFPPSRRCVFPELAEKAVDAKSKIPTGTEPSPEFLMKNILPTTRSYCLDNDVPKYTPTGFSTAEINAMGDFPAYDILSGVPLPEPYENFDPAKALPRPYRPFRWAYHQTMCECTITFNTTSTDGLCSFDQNGTELVVGN
jgi:hypothetical protein